MIRKFEFVPKTHFLSSEFSVKAVPQYPQALYQTENENSVILLSPQSARIFTGIFREKTRITQSI